MPEKCDEARFLEIVANHEMTILHEDGVYRHLRFKKPNSGFYWFDIVTWPGYLSFTGDCGCFVFSRLKDMLEFFRDDRSEATGLFINPRYWSQKVEGVDRGSGLKEYSEELFRTRIIEWLDEIEASPDLRKAVEEEVLSQAGEGEHEAMKAAYEFRHGSFEFSDFWEVDVKEYTFRFIWCLRAIVWGIKQYDQFKAAQSGEGTVST